MLIDAVKPALEDREIALDGVGISVATNVLFGGMHDGLVRGKIPANPSVDSGFVGHETAIAVCVPANQRTEHLRSNVRNMEATDVTIPLDKCHDGLLRCGRFVSSASGLSPDISFIGFHDAPGAA